MADWHVEPELNCLSRNDELYHVEPKVMKVLLQLAEHPDEVLSKERLIQAVWPDTFVSDDVLTRCISVLRRIMDDDPHSPRFIQTIPKTGYRLLAKTVYESPAPAAVNGKSGAETTTNGHQTPAVMGPADLHAGEAAGGTIATLNAPALEVTPSEAGSGGRPPQRRDASVLRYRSLLTVALVLLFIGVVLGSALWWTITTRKPPERAESFRIMPFTSYSGEQTQPAFSPEGSRIAFAWGGERRANRNIYVKQLGSEALLRVTSDGAEDFSPVWSPDGTQIAYLSSSEEDRGVFLVSSLRGASRKIYSPAGSIEWERGSLSWSPSGKTLAFPDGKSADTPSSIYSLSLETLRAEPISHPPAGYDGDLSPAYSPDGSQLAFVRAVEGAVRDVYVMPASGGNARRLTFDNRNVDSLAWGNDSKSILFSSNRGGKYSLWRVPAAGGEPQRLPMGTEDAFHPAVSRTGQRLAYVQSSATWSILRYSLPAGAGDHRPVPVVTSTQQDSAPAISPDGQRIAFQSWRSGTQEIWVASAQGANLERLTSIERSLTGSPAWSPDGKQIVFDSRPEGRSHIYVVASEGGAPRAITEGSYNDILPRFSAYGQAVYFSSNRSGSWQIWKTGLNGGTPRQITSNGGFIAAESGDGRLLYYTRNDAPGIWRLALDGGAETRILDQPIVGYWGYWSLTGDGIYYLNSSAAGPAISFLNFARGRSTRAVALQHHPPLYAGISVARDGRSLLITDQSDAVSHITLIEGFR